MRFIASVASAMLLLASSIHAHFTVQHPQAVGEFKDEDENSAPCGGYNPRISDIPITDFHVDGDAIATTFTHSTGEWLYRMTTDPELKSNWTQIYPIFTQNGGGQYCSPHVTISHEFIGQKVIIGITAHAEDGFLYQCSGVHFVEGTGIQPSDCKNSSGVTSEWTPDSILTSQLGHPSDTPPSARTPSVGASSKGEVSKGLGVMAIVGTMGVVVAIMMV